MDILAQEVADNLLFMDKIPENSAMFTNILIWEES